MNIAIKVFFTFALLATGTLLTIGVYGASRMAELAPKQVEVTTRHIVWLGNAAVATGYPTDQVAFSEGWIEFVCARTGATVKAPVSSVHYIETPTP